MTKFHINMKAATRLMLVAMILVLAFGTLSFAQGQRFKGPNAWSFGVMGDTQWTNATDPEGKNPEYVSAAIAGALQGQFISKGVKFVVETGDLSDRAGAGGMQARAAAAQPLFDQGIGFFPLRGNHETYGYLYGRDPNYNLNVPDFKTSFPQTQGIPNWGATNFSWPTIKKTDGTTDTAATDLVKGLSYAFDYNNATFVAVDVEQTAVKHQAAPNNPASCVTAVTPGTPAGTTPYCGQGYFYILSDLGNYNTTYVVYQAAYDIINGYTIPYDDYANALPKIDPITITAGTWFRIASNSRPTTDFKAWDVKNPLETFLGQPFDIYDPVDLAQNRVLEMNSSANTEFFPGKQQSWISGRLDKSTRGTDHAFVFSHRGIIAENHTDSFFGTDPTVTPADQENFFASLANNGVKYMVSAHDHLYNRALLTSPNGSSQVEQIITTGASTKFYTPAPLGNFVISGVDAKQRETQISQELLNIGYYIYTVDGPRVMVDYYSDATGNFMDDADYPYGDASIPARLYMPPFNFIKKESFGYSTNGKQFMIPQGESYASVQDGFATTAAKILGGTNKSTAVDGNDRPLIKAVNTGWTAKINPILASDILSLWGMTSIVDPNPVYALQMSFKDERPNSRNKDLGNGGYRLAAIDANGNWVNAVELNIGKQKQKFVKGPYNSSYGLGTYGIDMAAGVVWAVINYDADFAAVKF